MSPGEIPPPPGGPGGPMPPPGSRIPGTPLFPVDAGDGKRKSKKKSEVPAIMRWAAGPSKSSKSDNDPAVTKYVPPLFSHSMTAPFTSYTQMVESLVEHMPHLTNVRLKECRHPNSGKFSCWDMPLKGRRPNLLLEAQPRAWRKKSQGTALMAAIKQSPTTDIRSRTIVVEDLSPSLITTIGAAFWLIPEGFEEHLSHSHVAGFPCQGVPPKTWGTKLTPTGYMSLKWHRPVYRNWLKPHTASETATLLDLQTRSVEWTTSTQIGANSEVVYPYHEVSTTTNIFRRCWPLATDPERLTASETERVVSVWEERATVYRVQLGSCPLFILLLDPLPELRHVEDGFRTSTELPYQQAYNRNSDKPLSSSAGIFSEGALTPQKILELDSSLGKTNSTRNDLFQWLGEAISSRPDQDLTIMTALLFVVHRDISGYLHLVSIVLEEIGQDSTNDYLMETRLWHWRGLISRFQTELPDLRADLESFQSFVQGTDTETHQQSADYEFIPGTLKAIDVLIRKVERSYKALRAEIGLLDSKRGIAEAESVSKITELAFVFIPLTFVTGAFSMQIEELSTPAPVYAFVIAAILVVAISYVLRLVVRSTSIMHWKRAHWNHVREYAKLPPGSQVPLHSFAGYAFTHSPFPTFEGASNAVLVRRIMRKVPSAKLILFALLSAVLMSPITVIWTHHGLDTGYKSAVTVAALILVATVVWFVAGKYMFGVQLRVGWIRFLAGQRRRSSMYSPRSSSSFTTTTSGGSTDASTYRTRPSWISRWIVPIVQAPVLYISRKLEALRGQTASETSSTISLSTLA